MYQLQTGKKSFITQCISNKQRKGLGLSTIPTYRPESRYGKNGYKYLQVKEGFCGIIMHKYAIYACDRHHLV